MLSWWKPESPRSSRRRLGACGSNQGQLVLDTAEELKAHNDHSDARRQMDQSLLKTSAMNGGEELAPGYLQAAFTLSFGIAA